MVRARLPANPLFSVSRREPRAGNFGIGGPPAGCFEARFAPPSPLTLEVPFRGANSSHKFRADARVRPLFLRRGLLPANREPLQFRSGEQILHTNSAPPPESARLFQGAICSPLPVNPCSFVPGSKFFTQIPRRKPGAARLFQGAVCSPLLANPCGSVPGSKFFTQIPRRRPVPAGFSKAQFAPPSPRTLEVPFRGANSSHRFRANAQCRPAFSRRGLLPSPREPLRLRSGEQILHTNSAPTPSAGRLFPGAVCFPLPASPYGSVPGSKLFTQFPRRLLPPAGFSKARFAPR